MIVVDLDESGIVLPRKAAAQSNRYSLVPRSVNQDYRCRTAKSLRADDGLSKEQGRRTEDESPHGSPRAGRTNRGEQSNGASETVAYHDQWHFLFEELIGDDVGRRFQVQPAIVRLEH